jgi:hypothetical protein
MMLALVSAFFLFFKCFLLFFFFKIFLRYLNQNFILNFSFFCFLGFAFLDYKIFDLIYFRQGDAHIWIGLKAFIFVLFAGLALHLAIRLSIFKKTPPLKKLAFVFLVLFYFSFHLPFSFQAFSPHEKKLAALFFIEDESLISFGKSNYVVHSPSSNDFLNQMSFLLNQRVESLGDPDFFSKRFFDQYLQGSALEAYSLPVKFLIANLNDKFPNEVHFSTLNGRSEFLNYQKLHLFEKIFLSQIPERIRLLYFTNKLRDPFLSQEGLVRVFVSSLFQSFHEGDLLILSVHSSFQLYEKIKKRFAFFSEKMTHRTLEFLSFQKILHHLPFDSYQLFDQSKLEFLSNQSFAQNPFYPLIRFLDFQDKKVSFYCFFQKNEKQQGVYELSLSLEGHQKKFLKKSLTSAKVGSPVFSSKECMKKFKEIVPKNYQSSLFAFSRVLP